MRVPPYIEEGNPLSLQLYITGDNFGVEPPKGSPEVWTTEEKLIFVTIGRSPCFQPQRVGGGFVYCTLYSSLAPVVGSTSASITIAGQTGTLPDGSSKSLFVGCSGHTFAGTTTLPGGYGFNGEKCLPCPTGAV